MGHRCPRISFVIATHNRREVIENTIGRIQAVQPPDGDCEIILVDNASTDGTAAVAERRVDQLVRLRRNLGSCAKAFGAARAAGEFIVFLDDDSFPRPGSLERMLERFRADPGLACAGFSVHLPDGRQEASALPGVFVGCGVGFRAEALRRVGGLDRGFFMQAEEYDLCFRLAAAGHPVDVFPELAVDHLKTPSSRRSARTIFYDTRNNLLVARRLLPHPLGNIYLREWSLRYRWLAQRQGQLAAFQRGRSAGMALPLLPHRAPPARLSMATAERFFRWEELVTRFEELRRQGLRRVLLADFGKNIYAFWRAALHAGIQPVAIADDLFAAPGRQYRGVPLLARGQALERPFEAVVVANMAAPFAAAAHQYWKTRFEGVVFSWYSGFEHPPLNCTPAVMESSPFSADNSGEAQLPVASTPAGKRETACPLPSR